MEDLDEDPVIATPLRWQVKEDRRVMLDNLPGDSHLAGDGPGRFPGKQASLQLRPAGAVLLVNAIGNCDGMGAQVFAPGLLPPVRGGFPDRLIDIVPTLNGPVDAVL